MARIVFSPLITEISGSVGSGTIQRNRFGFTLRNKPLPRSALSANQFIVRSNMALLQSAWQNLTIAQRQAYSDFLIYFPATTKFNKKKQLTGHTLFLKYNAIRLAAGLSVLSSFDFQITDFISRSVTWSLNEDPPPATDFLRFSLDVTGGLDNVSFLVACSQVVSPSVNFAGSRLRVMSAVDLGSNDYDVTDSYIEKFGALPVFENYMFYSLTAFSTVVPVVFSQFTERVYFETP